MHARSPQISHCISPPRGAQDGCYGNLEETRDRQVTTVVREETAERLQGHPTVLFYIATQLLVNLTSPP